MKPQSLQRNSLSMKSTHKPQASQLENWINHRLGEFEQKMSQIDKQKKKWEYMGYGMYCDALRDVLDKIYALQNGRDL